MKYALVIITALTGYSAVAAQPRVVARYECKNFVNDLNGKVGGLTVIATEKMVPTGPMTPAFDHEFSLAVVQEHGRKVVELENAGVDENDVETFEEKNAQHPHKWVLVRDASTGKVKVSHHTNGVRHSYSESKCKELQVLGPLEERVVAAVEEKIGEEYYVGGWNPVILSVKIKRSENVAPGRMSFVTEATLRVRGPADAPTTIKRYFQVETQLAEVIEVREVTRARKE